MRRKRKAQKMLFEKYHPVMMGICLRYAKSRSEAEDVLLMGFSRIYKKIEQFGGQGSLEAWMKRIMVNIAIDNFRKNVKHYYKEDIDGIHDTSIPTDEIPDNFSVEEILKISFKEYMMSAHQVHSQLQKWKLRTCELSK